MGLDPVTAIVNLATQALSFGEKVFEATPQPLQAQAATDWATFTHNIGSFILSVQSKINAAVAPAPAPKA